jgi:hypothetical protein
MSRVEAATGLDRLPWLPDDEPAVRPAPRRSGKLIGSAFAAVLLVGGAAFWLGTRGVEELVPPAPAPHRAATTVKLPAPRPAEPALPQVKVAPLPEVEPIVAPPTPIIESPRRIERVAERSHATPKPKTEAAPATEAPKPPQPERLEPWPVRIVDGAAGRLVRIGAFSSVHQAKRGWWAIVKVNPTLEHLPALVVPVQSLRNGRTYYRLQMGTTSQAHSAVLCQRMRMIAAPCVVIGGTA